MNGKKEKLLVASIAKLDEIVIKTWETKFKGKVSEIYCQKRSDKMTTLKMHICCIKIAWSVFMRRNKYENIIFWQQFIGIYFGFFSVLSFKKKSDTQKTLILTFIFKERQGIKGKLHKYLVEGAIKSDYITKIVCHSTSEVDYNCKIFYKLSEKFTFCLLGEGIESRFSFAESGYYFSGGRSNRDYKTITGAFHNSEIDLIIACKPENLNGLQLSQNIKANFNAYGEKFLSLIQNSKAVIVLVKNNQISAGQLVILNALRFGKPVIVTKGNAMVNYLDPSYSILVEQSNVNDLQKAIHMLENDPSLLRKMSENAFNAYEKCFSIKRYAIRIFKIIS